MRLVVATTNPGKMREIEGLLDGLPVDVRTLRDFAAIPPPEESGATFQDNARQKALYYAARTGDLTVAEDSGLEIDALAGAPGVHSARFGGDHTSYPDKFRLIYRALAVAGPVTRDARFVAAVAVADGTQIVFETRAAVEGQIAPEPRGTGGFGYDPIFYYPPFGCTFGEAADRKGSVSHRAQAFRRFRQWLDGRLGAG